MPWTMGILLFTMSVTMLSSSLRAGPESFFETGTPYGAVSENPIRLGKLLIGAQGVVSDKEMEKSGLRSAEQSHEYRSNEEERFRLAKAKLRRLGPSVHCGNDSMTLRIPGSRTPHFLVDRGIESPVPLSEMPASCGFSLKRARRDVSLDAPYQGCHVRRQGGRYILPLFIMGAPVQMSCPVSPRLPTVSCTPSGMIISLGVRPDHVKVQVDGSWQPLLLAYSKCSFTLESVDGSLVVTAPFTGSCWDIKDTDMQLPLMYGDRQVTLSCPGTQPTLAPTTDDPFQDPIGSQQMFYPFPFGGHVGYPPYSYGRPGVRPIPPTVPPTTPAPLQDPNQQMFPQMYPMSMFDPYYFNSRGFPAVPQRQQSKYPMFPSYMYHFKSPVKATTTPSTTTAAQLDQVMVPQRQQSKYPMFPPYMYHFKSPVKATTTPSTTTAAQLDQFMVPQHQQSKYPMFPPYMYHFKSPVKATTTPSTTTAAQLDQFMVPQHQQSKYPMFPPYMYHFKSPVKATTTPSTTTAAQLDQFMVPQHQQSKYPMFPPYMYPFKSPVKATTPPTPATAPQLDQFVGYPPRYPKFYGPQPFVHPHVQYPFMPKYPQDPVFPPHSPKPVSSPAWSQSSYWSRKQ
ncbi:uncharacterized protein LOC130085701 [Rhinichthys klamathensis goyatoka]|uniref:uncharacterized protein LOC130085701 n=1 Tax=Rhinichthys klamathensis goyatoka TaxID=3034132 RepID=UPI0024B5956D|nr:uncharacterized protein LOC130085701 [Rhinichthys klamathensis goyatoka]